MRWRRRLPDYHEKRIRRKFAWRPVSMVSGDMRVWLEFYYRVEEFSRHGFNTIWLTRGYWDTLGNVFPEQAEDKEFMKLMFDMDLGNGVDRVLTTL